MLYALDRFNQYAVREHLSAGAILLWHRLYFSMSRKGQFADVPQNTSVLTAMLDVTRQGLQQMRQVLIDKGFLAIRQDSHQQTYYTLLLNGAEVQGRNVVRETVDGAAEELSDAAKEALREPLARAREVNGEDAVHMQQDMKKDVSVKPAQQWSAASSGDVILTNRYGSFIDGFCQKFGPAMKGDLMQWAEMRRKNGWTLTKWGMEVLLEKLATLAAGDAVLMGKIVAQSVKRRLKGFYALKVQARPSGAKLLQMEAAESKSKFQGRNSSPCQSKFKPEGRDLSFLER